MSEEVKITNPVTQTDYNLKDGKLCMTQEDKLKKIIEKAVENDYLLTVEGTDTLWQELTDEQKEKATKSLWNEFSSWRIFLFDHSFAKAIWGEEKSYCSACERQHLGNNSDCDMGCGDCTEAYKFHLQQAVISDDPIDYYVDNM